MKVVWTALVAFALLALLLAGWLGAIAYFTTHADRACVEQVGMIKHSNHTREELQRVLDDYSAKKAGIGLQMTVIFPDGTIWSGTSGYASLEKRCPLTLDHHLYIGSITKLYTAALVMEQVEKGAISLDDTLDQWVDLPYAKTVTVRMLLNHTSGIPNYTDDFGFLIRYFGLPKKRWRTDELFDVIRKKPLRFEPGSRHESDRQTI